MPSAFTDLARALLPPSLRAPLGAVRRGVLRRLLASEWMTVLPAEERMAVAATLTRAALGGSTAALAKERLASDLWSAIVDDQQTPAHAVSVVAHHLRRLERYTTVRDKRVLELGPGHSMAGGLLWYAVGAAYYTGVDAHAIAGRGADFYRAVRALVYASLAGAEVLDRFDAVLEIQGDRITINDACVTLRQPIDAADLPFTDRSFDVVLSNATLEHVVAPAEVAHECARVLAPGGFALHGIDLSDHRDRSRPLAFLREEEASWRERFAADPFNYTNRWRASDFAGAFVAAGLEVVEQQAFATTAVDAALRATFSSPFRARDSADLECTGVYFVLRRP